MLRKIALVLLLALVALLAWEMVTFPDIDALRTEAPETTAFMERRKEQLRAAGKDDSLRYDWVPYGRISRHLRRAVLVSEDSGFYEHEGVDLDALKEALRRDWERRELAFGGSTITQQLAKNLYLSPSKNPYRKLKELIIARELERKLSKKRILEIYLNVVEFGERVYGAEAAARHYFGKPASQLTPSEAALLAGALPNPRRMNPADPSKRLWSRQKTILSRMKRWGHLAETQVLAEAKKEERTVEVPLEEPLEEPGEEPAIEPGETTTDTQPLDPTMTDTAEAPPVEPLPPEPELLPPTGTGSGSGGQSVVGNR